MDVVILAGGLGTRLRSVVSEVPKCMAPVSSRPFLYYLLNYLADYSNGQKEGNANMIERVVLSVGYLREKIYEWVDSYRAHFPFQIEYAVEEQPLGTGGGIRLALNQCRAEQVAILNGDTFFDVDLNSFFEFHSQCDAMLSIALKPMEHFSRYGTVNVSGNGMITAFNEKCYCERGLINGGVYLANRVRLADYLSTKPEKFSFEKEVLETLVNSQNSVSPVAVGGAECRADHKTTLGAVYGFESNDYFIDIGIPEDYARAEREFKIASGSIKICEEGDTLFLDRDGVINRLRVNDYVKCIDEFEFLPGVLSAIAKWSLIFKRIIIVTNQRGVGKGVMSEASLIEIHENMVKRIANANGRIDAIYYCTALTNEDYNRKPNPGMAHKAVSDFPDIDLTNSVMIGDSDSDRQFAQNAEIGRFICV